MILWSIRRWPIRPTWWVRRSLAAGQSLVTISTNSVRPGRRSSGSIHHRIRLVRSWTPGRSNTGWTGPASADRWSLRRVLRGVRLEAEPISVLHPSINAGRHDGLLAVHSLSKRSNLAGYRAGFVAGDRQVVADLLAVRKHAGMLVPRPVQEVMIDLLGDHDHVEVQRARYLKRRTVLRPALEAAGFRIEHSEGAIYLWATRDEDCHASVDYLARMGILVAPGDFRGSPRPGTYASPSQQPMSGLRPPLHVSWTPLL